MAWVLTIMGRPFSGPEAGTCGRLQTALAGSLVLAGCAVLLSRRRF